jgi:cell division protein FtsZ
VSGARGVLVNITASRSSLKGKEIKDIMAEVNSFASGDALVIKGVAYDESMAENLRVTVVATGLGRERKALKIVPAPVQKTGTYDATPAAPAGAPDYNQLDTPAVWRTARDTAISRVQAMENHGVDQFDIPAFLRKQAD